jgi:deoxyribonuclease V
MFFFGPLHSPMIRAILDIPEPSTTKEAIAIQKSLSSKVILQDQFESPIQYLAGVDVGFEDNRETARAAVVVLEFPTLKIVEHHIARRPVTFPYIPGLLAFREVPVVLDALAKVNTHVDMLLCDGNGYIHPRRCGIACHLGVVTGLPSIGVAKNYFLGDHGELGQDKGDWQPMYHKNERLGAVLRSRTGVKPLYISSGHRISLETSIAYVMACVTKYRLPETTRLSDQLSKQNGIL